MKDLRRRDVHVMQRVFTQCVSMRIDNVVHGSDSTGWAKKTGLFLDQITLQRLMIERHVICQTFQNIVLNEVHNLHVSAVKYSLPNMHKLSIPPKLH